MTDASLGRLLETKLKLSGDQARKLRIMVANGYASSYAEALRQGLNLLIKEYLNQLEQEQRLRAAQGDDAI